MRLVSAVQRTVEVFGEIEYAMYSLFSCQALCLPQAVAIIGGMDIRRGIEVAYELTGRCGVGEVHYRHGNLSYHLVVIYP